MATFWDQGKAEENRRKHGVSFTEAQTIFLDPLVVSTWDAHRSAGENRFFAIAESIDLRLLAVAYTIRDGHAWIISARVPTRAEKKRYMRGDELRDKGIGEDEDDPTAHLDWSKAVRGRHYIRPRGPITVVIDEKLAMFFRDGHAVSEALRLLIREGRVGPLDPDGPPPFPMK
ncbi:MAG: BrnT family toxin [Acidobacteriota bacterium]